MSKDHLRRIIIKLPTTMRRFMIRALIVYETEKKFKLYLIDF